MKIKLQKKQKMAEYIACVVQVFCASEGNLH